ncbi:MAG: 4-hydroxythreonine-4-phosphate dehydrogenase PdxA, partial [Gammaproteobacteria bacterium]
MSSCASAGIRPRIALTPGEPAGIGPDLVIRIAQDPWPAALIVFGDPELLRSRAALLGLPLTLCEVHGTEALTVHKPGTLSLIPVALAQPARCGALDPANAASVMETLARACRGCLDGHFDAMVTAPVHKGVINAAGIPFSGHTEYLAERCGAPLPVMMLCTERL